MAQIDPGSSVGVGIIGTGRIAASHANAIGSTAGAELRAVADVDAGRRTEWLAKHAAGADVRAYGDYRELLEDDRVDLAIVALPHWLHGEAASAAASAGKHVLVEKPMAITLEECDRMIESTRSAGVLLAVGHMMHWHPLVVEAKRRLDDAKFGRIIWGADLAYAPRRYGSNPDWFYDRTRGGGQLLANGSHLIDRLLWTIAAPSDVAATATTARARPVAVSAIVGTYFNRDDPRYCADDGAVLFIRFDTGQAATMHLTGHFQGQGPEGRADYICEHGMVRYTVKQLYVTDPDAPDDREYHEVPMPGAIEPFGPQLRDVVDAIRTGRQPGVPGEWGRLVVQVMLAAEESSRRGREVMLDS